MKRWYMLLVVLVAFLMGAAAEKVVKKFPYLSDEWNKPEGLTRIEAACLRMSYGYASPIEVDGRLIVTKFLVEPTPKGITIKAHVLLKPGEAEPPREKMGIINIRLIQQVRANLGLGPRDDFPMGSRIFAGEKLVNEHHWSK